MDEAITVHKEDCAVKFQTQLKAGKADLQTWFVDTQGESRGAYYVYAKRLS
jgi:hypothetical protein